jgi:hypothetical protein
MTYPRRTLQQIANDMAIGIRDWTTREYIEAVKVCMPPWYMNKYLGAIAGAQLVEIRGFRGAIAVGPALLDLSADQVTFIRYPTAATAYVLQSTSANDDGAPAGTGAHIVHIDFLNALGVADHVNVTLNGVGQVAALAADQAIAINGMKVVQAGATRTNEGAITLTDAPLNEELSRIPIATGRSHACRYHVPVGYNLLVSRFLMECGASVGDGQGFDLVGTIYDPDTLAPSLPGCLRDLGPWALLEGQKWEHIFEEVQIIPASTPAIISEIAAWVVGDVAGTDDAAASIFGLLVAV